MHYEEIYTIHQIINERSFILNGAKSIETAANMAVKTLSEDIHSCYSKEGTDGKQAWEVVVKSTSQDVGTVAILTEEEIAQNLKNGKIIKYCDITSAICMLWLATLRVFD